MEVASESAVVVGVAAAGVRDRLLTFLTRGRGSIRVYARRQSRRPQAQVFYERLQGGEITWVQGAGGSPGRLVSFSPSRVWPGIRSEFDRTVQALAFLELVAASLTEGEPQADLFALLTHTLNRIETDPTPGVARLIATIRLLAISGFAPHFGSCVFCGAAPANAGGRKFFSVESGGMVCGDCSDRSRERAGRTVTSGACGFMERALLLPDSRIWRLRANPAVAGEVSRILDEYVAAQFGFRPRSSVFFEKLSPPGERGRSRAG